MTWDGVPEHRNLGGDGEQPKPLDRIRDLLGGLQKPQPETPQMPADPFSGMAAEATAMHEIFRSLNAGGFTEQQALFYIACLMQVGNALKAGGLLPPDAEE